jgi:integrase
VDARLALWIQGLADTTTQNYLGSLRLLSRSLGLVPPSPLDGTADPSEEEREAAGFLLLCSKAQARAVLEGWAQHMEREGLQPSSIGTRIASVRAWLEFGAEHDWCPPPPKIRLRGGRERKPRPAPAIEDIARAIDRLERRGDDRSVMESALLCVLLVLALRRAEARGILLRDLEEGIGADHPVTIRIERKGGRVDRLALPRTTWRRLRAWLARRSPELYSGEDSGGPVITDSPGPVFCGWIRMGNGAALGDSDRRLLGRDYIYSLTRREGLGAPHAVRRTAARWIQEHGGASGGPASADHVRAALGHSSLKTTAEYLDSGEDDARAERLRLARAVERAAGK